MIKIGLVGCGNVGKYICENIDNIGVDYRLFIYDRNSYKIDKICKVSDKIFPCYKIETLLNESLDFLIEAASREFAKKYGPIFLKKGISLITLSNGFLVSDEIRNMFIQCAEKGNSKIYLPGAPPGIDAALVMQVHGIKSSKYISLRNSKHPIAQKMGKGTYFSGTTREAMNVFEKTLNTASVLAEATIGYDDSLAEVGFYDEIEGYELKLNIETDIAQIDVCLHGKLDEESGKFSKYAALSVIALLKKKYSKIVIGI